MKSLFSKSCELKFNIVKDVLKYLLLSIIQSKRGVDRYKTETMESLIKVEEFDDVKQIADEINSLQDQVYELGIFVFNH